MVALLFMFAVLLMVTPHHSHGSTLFNLGSLILIPMSQKSFGTNGEPRKLDLDEYGISISRALVAVNVFVVTTKH